MTTLFISDLHLTAGRPRITDLFFEFLDREARDAKALYILGDFFEYWIGDDALEQTEFRPIAQALRAVVDAGTPVSLMRGNRDFLLGGRFERETGCRLIEDPTVIDLYGTPVLLMHGDTLCTDDVEYLEFRKMTRAESWQREFLAKSSTERDAIARNNRELSRQATANKAPEIMDVTQSAVANAMREHGVRHLIHGHTHRPGKHTFDLDGEPAHRIVLGDWYRHGSVLRCTGADWTLGELPLPTAASPRLVKSS
jgi:UDP-2,3-diacylglucosamine hydrolase